MSASASKGLAGAATVLPPPSKYARNADPERDAAILRGARQGLTYTQIGQAVGMKPGSVEKRLYTLHERIADAGEERAREQPGWPRDMPCLSCGKVERRQHRGDRVCGGCKQTTVWRAGDGVRGVVAGIRRGRG